MTTCADKDKQTLSVYDIRCKERLWAHLKRNKKYGMFMLVYINAVKYSAPQPSNARVHHKKRPPIRRKRFGIYTNMR